MGMSKTALFIGTLHFRNLDPNLVIKFRSNMCITYITQPYTSINPLVVKDVDVEPMAFYRSCGIEQVKPGL